MYKRVESLLENTEFEARINKDGKVISYRISPKKGYKLHEITLDEMIVDEETLEETKNTTFTNQDTFRGNDRRGN